MEQAVYLGAGIFIGWILAYVHTWRVMKSAINVLSAVEQKVKSL
jgi:hypothetical protein